MGNLASCSGAPTGYTPAPALATRVLLIDGSMLKFRSPVKVISLLLDYPNHVICPLDSLKPGLHSLSRLLPDEKLQLGRLYLLLPFKTHMKAQQNGLKKLVQGREQKPLQAGRGGKERSAGWLVSTQKLNVGFVNGEGSDMGFAEAGDVDEFKRNVGRRDNVKRSISEKTSARKDMICDWSSEEIKGRQGLLRKSEMGSSKCSNLNRKSDVGGRKHTARRSAGSSTSGKGGKYAGLSLQRIECRDEDSSVIRRPLCDTPELQRAAYRSLRLRRSTSWTPRLQPILERQ